MQVHVPIIHVPGVLYVIFNTCTMFIIMMMPMYKVSNVWSMFVQSALSNTCQYGHR